MRLIDADALKKDLKSVTLSNGTLVNTNAVLYLLEEYPTAYDVDKVVEQLEELKRRYDIEEFGIRGVICKAIKAIKDNKPTSGYYILNEALDMAIQALETVQKYKELESELSKRNLTIDHIREYMEFEDECVEQGFTFKSLLEAREKQSRKKPILSMREVGYMAIDYADGHGEIKQTENNFWRCPKCKSVVGERIIVHGRIHDRRKNKYCENCGQRIDWEGIKNE